jgi:CheY-like chemotaxis protein
MQMSRDVHRRRNIRVQGQGSNAIPRLTVPRPEAPFRAPRILIVEDHDDTRKMYAQYFSYVGSEVITARNGRSALNKARTLKPSVIVLDLMMPEMDGWSALRDLKSDERTSGIPVIIVTGHDLGQYLENAALAAGAAVYLSKPCLPDELARHVRSVLDRRDPTT